MSVPAVPDTVEVPWARWERDTGLKRPANFRRIARPAPPTVVFKVKNRGEARADTDSSVVKEIHYGGRTGCGSSMTIHRNFIPTEAFGGDPAELERMREMERGITEVLLNQQRQAYELKKAELINRGFSEEVAGMLAGETRFDFEEPPRSSRDYEYDVPYVEHPFFPE